MSKNSILIVEDEAILAADLSERLKKNEYQVIGIASSAKQALDIIQDTRPDVVLMDIKIQGDKDGIETAGDIHERYDIPVIYLTAYSNKSLLERAKITEPFGYLVKPVDNSQLTACIEMALYKAKMEAERARLIQELETALNEIKVLQGVLPICSHCKNIRNKEGFWDRLETYIRKHSEIKFSHGICPDCADKYYPDMNLNDT